MQRLFSLATVSILALSSGFAAPANADNKNKVVGAVYTATNAPSGNAILAFSRGRDGNLTAAGEFATGGNGTGKGLGNQGALALDSSNQWLLAVNAGSSELSVFAIDDEGLALTDKTPSGGQTPVSVAVHRNLVYVLNAGSDNLSGFRLNRRGELKSLADSTRPLSGHGTGAAEVQFNADGDTLVVTEKATGNILIYAVGDDGLLSTPTIVSSPAPTPFGFAFNKRDQFFVSEAAGGQPNVSSVSSYRLRDGVVGLVTAAAPTHQTAACWVVVTDNGRHA
ncbi:MAG: beta-propeller fold lactonase family protein [Gammaproteobacteria bacterium]|nr:beta-propeller fold lactonase family protein [Gammaproteobacteria bacterium]